MSTFAYDRSATIRRCQRLILMANELHQRGYQRLRILTYQAPLAWRFHIAPATAFDCNGLVLAEPTRYPYYSSADENLFFGWEDARQANAMKLAELFCERYPTVCADGMGRDWDYAGWLDELVSRLRGTWLLPILSSEIFYVAPDELRFMPLCDYDPELPTPRIDQSFPLPPPIDLH